MEILFLFLALMGLPLVIIIAGAVILLSSLATLLANAIPLFLAALCLFVTFGLLLLPFKSTLEKHEARIKTAVKILAVFFTMPLMLLIVALPLYLAYTLWQSQHDILIALFMVLYVLALIRVGYALIQRWQQKRIKPNTLQQEIDAIHRLGLHR